MVKMYNYNKQELIIYLSESVSFHGRCSVFAKVFVQSVFKLVDSC